MRQHNDYSFTSKLRNLALKRVFVLHFIKTMKALIQSITQIFLLTENLERVNKQTVITSPFCMIHANDGFLLFLLKEVQLHFSILPSE